jgi:hypothetical protein
MPPSRPPADDKIANSIDNELKSQQTGIDHHAAPIWTQYGITPKTKSLAVACDIETGALPHAADLFDPADVKLGNLKDEAKIQAKIAEGKAAFLERAALSPHLAEILCVTYSQGTGEENVIVDSGGNTERIVLLDFWSHFEWATQQKTVIVGFNFLSFDLWFIVERSHHHGLDVPFSLNRTLRYQREPIIDLLADYKAGFPEKSIKLATLAKSYGLAGKTEGPCEGANFAKYWRSEDKEKRTLAAAYARRDAEISEMSLYASTCSTSHFGVTTRRTR